MSKLEDMLYKYFNYKSFRYPQKEIIEAILAKKDTLSILPTGLGKSLIYQLAGLMIEGLVLVISPLLSLMTDQVLNLKARKIKATYINSMQDKFLQLNIYKNIKKYKFLYVASERLEDPMFLQYVKEVSFLVIDEAHTIRWGIDFRKSLYHINDFVKKLKKRPIIACFTATSDINLFNLIKEKTGLIEPFITYISPLKNNLEFIVYKERREYYLNKILNAKRKSIVYLLTRIETETLYNYYKNYYECYYYHGTLATKEKEREYLGFKESKQGIMFATNSFGMGIDILDIRQIILYDLPLNLADLVQQAGRAGRDLRQAYCYILYTKKTFPIALNFIYQSSDKKIKLKEFDRVIQFCFAKNKQAYIEEYFKLG